MAYEKQTWVTGETITAQKLNHMEDGIASGGVSVITITLTDADGGGFEASTETSYADALSAMISGAVIFKLEYLSQTYDVFGLVDYDPEEPDYSGINIVDIANLSITINWSGSGITVESNT